MLRNARFWYWCNDGWVKITLKPEQEISWHASWPTDEGWSSEYFRFYFDGEVVEYEWRSDGSDCDGRLAYGSVCFCSLDKLADKECDDGTLVPDWSNRTRYTHDYEAVRAGY